MRQFTIIYSSLLFLLLVLALLYGNSALTSYATAVEIKEQVKDFVQKLPAAQVVDDADVCLIIPQETGELSYEIIKSGGTITLKEYCNLFSTYDIAIKFKDYNAFLRTYQNPDNVANTHGTDYVFLPSKTILAGGEFNCEPELQDKYCIAPYLYFSKAELQTINNCCADYELSASQKSRLEQAKPTGLLAANLVVLSLLFAVLLFIIVFSLILTRRVKKKSKEKERIDELKTYVVDMLSKGYSIAGIKESLSSAGWTSQQIDEAFK